MADTGLLGGSGPGCGTKISFPLFPTVSGKWLFLMAGTMPSVLSALSAGQV
jgi:hypothetical protein